jgi:tetratricopeptide (TPR) repeat protein
LPVDAGTKTRPSKPAAFALLGRVYLQIGNYVKAKQNADSCLSLSNKLIPYFDISPPPTLISMNSPFPIFPTIPNPEMIYYTYLSVPVALLFQKSRVDTVLFKMYDLNDARRVAYFYVSGNNAYFKGSYHPTGVSNNILFNGIATDEVYLIRAECYARAGNKELAMDDLNSLLGKRIKSFTKFMAIDASDALRQVLRERRKELLFRGLRWSDLRRLNKDPNFAIAIQRKLSSQSIILPPNSLKYVMLIPQKVIDLSGIQQNPR